MRKVLSEIVVSYWKMIIILHKWTHFIEAVFQDFLQKVLALDKLYCSGT